MKILKYLVAAACSFAASALAQNAYVKTVLVANDPKYHPQLIDKKMVDAWGIAIRPPGAGGHFWIANAATGTSVEYIGDVNGTPLKSSTASLAGSMWLAVVASSKSEFQVRARRSLAERLCPEGATGLSPGF